MFLSLLQSFFYLCLGFFFFQFIYFFIVPYHIYFLLLPLWVLASFWWQSKYFWASFKTFLLPISVLSASLPPILTLFLHWFISPAVHVCSLRTPLTSVWFLCLRKCQCMCKFCVFKALRIVYPGFKTVLLLQWGQLALHSTVQASKPNCFSAQTAFITARR